MPMPRYRSGTNPDRIQVEVYGRDEHGVLGGCTWWGMERPGKGRYGLARAGARGGRRTRTGRGPAPRIRRA
ncbi:hypothetical protein [Streptomyces goshikiensis]|uniref:hypothetical protein n=1 Tax=Streptomyces goshikiensis TaxID=1942 RepID=UPI0036553357